MPPEFPPFQRGAPLYIDQNDNSHFTAQGHAIVADALALILQKSLKEHSKFDAETQPPAP